MARRDLPPGARAALVDRLRRLLEGRREIRCAYLHGSFLEGGPYRDVDLAVWIESVRRAGWRAYELDLAVELQLALGQPVDVRVLNDAPLAFRFHALRGQLLVVRDPEWLDELRARTWDEYFDFLPFARRYLREVLGA